MTQAAEAVRPSAIAKPKLVFFHSRSSGKCRRVEGFIAQVLQRRRNHDSFAMLHVDVDQHPELAERFRVDTVPTLVVVADRRVDGRLPQPSGCGEISDFLQPWLK